MLIVFSSTHFLKSLVNTCVYGLLFFCNPFNELPVCNAPSDSLEQSRSLSLQAHIRDDNENGRIVFYETERVYYTPRNDVTTVVDL